ncbi:TRIM71 [Branchiostoma lanceolatum]|uniref:TRIM71 protein n=1 Tax=Branchiostoma lanceolatum TaxID=7740 RepID=A0A8J9ZTC4_BRALA|nr:TRIM71 [Branchiostoma lanceolatum]
MQALNLSGEKWVSNMSEQDVKRYYCFIKNKVSSDWKDLAWCLGFDTPDIENIDGKHRDDKSRCMDLLQQWYKKKGNAATIHELIKALHDAELQHVVDSLKDKYFDLPVLLQDDKRKAPQDDEADWPRKRFQTNPCGAETDLPVYLNLGMVQDPTAMEQAEDIYIRKRLLKLESTLFTKDVFEDRERYKETQQLFLSHKAFLKEALKGSVILLLTFLRQTDVDRFYHNHYRVGEGTLSQQLSHILISDHLQDKVKGAQLIVRLHVKHEDYVQVRGRLGQGLDCTTSIDNLLALPPPSRHLDHSSLSGLDLAVVGRDDHPCTDGTDDFTTLYRQVQSAVRTTRERSEKILLDQKAEMTKKQQQLEKNNKDMEGRIEELELTVKQLEEGGRWQKDAKQAISDKHSMEKSKATSTGQVKQSVVQPQWEDTGTSVRSIRVGHPWVRKVKFGGRGSGKGRFYGPWGVAVSQINEVYIADWFNSRIQMFTMDGVYIKEFTTTLPGETGKELKPQDVAVDRKGNLWVVSSDHVAQYSWEGTSLVKIDLPYVYYLRGITVAMATEQVIVTEYDGQNGLIRVFNQDGSNMGTYGSGHRSPKPWCPKYVAMDGEGNILVTDGNNHCVHVLDREGNFKFNFGSDGSQKSKLTNPWGICVDGMGTIIVADRGNGCVATFDSQGRFLGYIGSRKILSDIGSGMKYPCGVAVSPGGDVVVTDYDNNTVSVWTQG